MQCSGDKAAPPQKRRSFSNMFQGFLYSVFNEILVPLEQLVDMRENDESILREMKYNKVFDIFNVFRLEKFLITVISVQLLALTYNLFILPFHFLNEACRLLWEWGGGSGQGRVRGREKRVVVVVSMLIRLTAMTLGSVILAQLTNPSVIYHKMRGQSLFKLYMIKAVNEIVDMLLRGYGQGIVDNFARAMQNNQK